MSQSISNALLINDNPVGQINWTSNCDMVILLTYMSVSFVIHIHTYIHKVLDLINIGLVV